MIKIGALDSLTKDCIIKLSDCENAQHFLARPEISASLLKNDKMILSEGQYHKFSALAAPCISEEQVGGSAFNTTYTIASALNEVKVDFITPPSSNKENLKHPDNLEFIPTDPDDANLVIPRVSYICLDERGNKQVLKYLGNILEYLETRPQYIAALKKELSKTIAVSNLFFLPGGITKKFPYEIFSHVLDEAKKSKTKLIFSLPTHSDFTLEESELYARALTQSAIILGNADEMRNTVGLISRLTKLNATSFITDGGRDAYVIISGRITRIKPLALPRNVLSLTGAGDAAYAGFIIGLLQKQGPVAAAELAMKFSHQVLQVSGPRLEDPRSLLVMSEIR